MWSVLIGLFIGIITTAIIFLRPLSRKKTDFNKHNLVTYEIKSKKIDSVLFNELWRLRKAYWPADTPQGYKKLLDASKCKFVLFRDAIDGSLRGVYTKKYVNGNVKDGKPQTRTLYLGHLFFYTYYRGSFMLGSHMMKDFLHHWWTTPRGVKCYVVFSCISYKSYVAAAHTYPNLYPTYLNVNDPKFKEAKMVASQVMGHLYPEEWNAQEWRLHLKDTDFDAANLREEHMKDPHIKFFSEMNPDFQKGITFPGVFNITLFSLLQTMWYVRSRTATVRPHRQKPITKRHLARTTIPEPNPQDEIKRQEKEDEKKEKIHSTMSKFRAPSLPGPLPDSLDEDSLPLSNSSDPNVETAEKEKAHRKRVRRQEQKLRSTVSRLSMTEFVPEPQEENPYYSGRFELSPSPVKALSGMSI